MHLSIDQIFKRIQGKLCISTCIAIFAVAPTYVGATEQCISRIESEALHEFFWAQFPNEAHLRKLASENLDLSLFPDSFKKFDGKSEIESVLYFWNQNRSEVALAKKSTNASFFTKPHNGKSKTYSKYPDDAACVDGIHYFYSQPKNVCPKDMWPGFVGYAFYFSKENGHIKLTDILAGDGVSICKNGKVVSNGKR